jgi:hypothetical protein
MPAQEAIAAAKWFERPNRFAILLTARGKGVIRSCTKYFSAHVKRGKAEASLKEGFGLMFMIMVILGG